MEHAAGLPVEGMQVIVMSDFLAPFDVPMTVHVVDGEVVVLGPSGVAIALTPQAARISGERLVAAADEAGPAEPDPA